MLSTAVAKLAGLHLAARLGNDDTIDDPKTAEELCSPQTSIEAKRRGHFSFQSDLWSAAVLVWQTLSKRTCAVPSASLSTVSFRTHSLIKSGSRENLSAIPVTGFASTCGWRLLG